MYLDGPGGTQVPESVIAAMAGYLRSGNANLGGRHGPSAETWDVLSGARLAAADLFNASAEEIVFGQNMTSLTFALAHALARTWEAGDEVVVTMLDHEANVSPWRQLAAERGVKVRHFPFDPHDGSLDLARLADGVGPRTRLVALTHASNAVGVIPGVRAITRMVREASDAVVFVDAVHYTPHGVVDVRDLGCDALVASAYKLFGPHTGMLFVRGGLARVPPYKLDPAPSEGPSRWETGTQSFESLAGLSAAVDYLASHGTGSGRRERILTAMQRLRHHEETLARRFVGSAAEMPGITIHTIGGADPVSGRTPTFAFGVEGRSAAEVADILGRQGMYVSAGHYYAIGVMHHLGVLESGGLVRVGFTHYNTIEEVDRLLVALGEIAEP